MDNRYDDPEQEAIGRDDMLEASMKGRPMQAPEVHLVLTDNEVKADPELPWVFYDLTTGMVRTSRGDVRVIDWESVENVVNAVLGS